MAYPAAVQAALDRAGVSTLEEWNALMSQGTAGGVNRAQRAAGHDLSEGTWTRVEDASAFAERANAELARAAEARAAEARAAAATWAAVERAMLPDMSAPSLWNPTPTNYPDPLGRTDLERQQAEIAAAEPVAAVPFTGPVIAPWGPLPIPDLFKSDAEIMLGAPSFVQPQEARVGIPQAIVNIGKSLVGAALGGIMDSRRDDPPAIPGAPGVNLQEGWNPFDFPGNVTKGWEAAQAGYTAASNVITGNVPGMGAVNPKSKSVKTLVCPRGYCLAIDGKCYPKSLVPKSLRKWKPEPRPIVSRSDQKAIQRSAAAKKRLVTITKKSGAFASLTRPHHHHTGKKK